VTVTCRPAATSDTTGLLEVHRAAFAEDVEADLVAALLSDQPPRPTESWVAVSDGEVVGHVLLTGGEVPGRPEVSVMLLCPLAVAPSHQHAGVGTALTEAALKAARARGVHAVSVFGDPGYYSRFGFASLLPSGPLPAYDVAEAHRAAWQTLLLEPRPGMPATLDGVRIQWAPPIMRPALWQA
jgi:putative acetyltransferase